MKEMLIYEKPTRCHGPEDVYELLDAFRELNKEYFIVFGLNARHDILFRHIVSIGCLNACIVHPREVFRPLVSFKKGVIAAIIAHNHCSGAVEPSVEDLNITSRLSACGELLGIEILDHLIVSCENNKSLRDYGWPEENV